MTAEQTIALNKLVHSRTNVRLTGRTEGIAELAASIAAHGLRQNLNVLPCADGGQYEVVAGSRRLRAMKQLVRAGKLAKDAPVPCLVLGEGDDPAEISLAENAMRSAMHPDDQFEAFRALIEEKGLSVEEVAARFGVTPAVVRQRLKLAHVSPKLRALFRKGEMGLEHVMALAISDDHAAQEEAWENLPDWNREPSLLKDALTHGTVAASDRLARFIGMDAYLAAGGAVLRDLFDAEDEGYLTDRALVLRLATAKLDEEAKAVKAEGWQWVKPELTRDHSIGYRRVWPVTDEESEDDENGVFAPEDIAQAGAVLRIGPDGELQVERGLLHPDDAKAAAKAEKAAKGETANPAGCSAALVRDLTAHRTAALRIELARHPGIALAFTVHALASGLLYNDPFGSCLDLRATSEGLERHIAVTADSPAHQAMLDEGARWGALLPQDPADLLTWSLAQPQDVLVALLAFLAGLSVNAVRSQDAHDPRHAHADCLATALSLDMTQWWTPSVEGFWQRLPKAALTTALVEAGAPLTVNLGSLKKTEAARHAANALAGRGWLPEPLRIKA